MAKQALLCQDAILPNICVTDNKVCHLVFDNFDINEETPSGFGTTISTNGIIVQEVTSPMKKAHVTLETEKIQKTKQRSLNFSDYCHSVMPDKKGRT